MKSVLIIIDGLGDEPIAELGEKTPLECAFAPNIHYIASRGQVGLMKTTFPGFPIESMVCIMGILGFDPVQYYPSGRASFEALAKGIPLGNDDLVLRCNTVTVDLETQTLVDFTAGTITDSDARKLISQIKLPFENWELYPGQSYRNILIIRGANVDPKTVQCFEPHMNIGKSVASILPVSNNVATDDLVGQLRQFLLATQHQISSMKLPAGCLANMLWVWSPSSKPVWPTFRERTGINAAVVGGLDFLHGIAMAAQIHYDIIPGATGYIDTNYSAKADFTIRYLKDYDFVLTHINAADEEAHLHNYKGKIEAIEKIDRYVVGPVLYDLVKNYGEEFRVAICGDHTTRCRDGKHTNALVPYGIFGSGIAPSGSPSFSESMCTSNEPILSLQFLDNICLLGGI